MDPGSKDDCRRLSLFLHCLYTGIPRNPLFQGMDSLPMTSRISGRFAHAHYGGDTGSAGIGQLLDGHVDDILGKIQNKHGDLLFLCGKGTEHLS